MTESIVAHHPQAPSKLENLDPKSGGCAAFVSNPEGSEKAASGTLKHTATSTGDLSILGGDRLAEGEVARVTEFMNSFREEYPVVHQEITLKTEKIFGTLDYIGLDEKQTKAVIIDAKFGAWAVTPARSNLQGWAYTLLAFNHWPSLKRIKIIFYAAKYGTHTEHTIWRHRLAALEKRVYRIVDRASQVSENPAPGDYTPNALNCSFCVRLNCPARLALMGTLVRQWTGRPLELPRLNLLEVTTPQLAALKRLSNVFKTFAAAVDNEAKRRAFDEGTVVEGYEIAEKSGARTVVGANNITEANKVLVNEWNMLEFSEADWGKFVLENVELSVADLEKEVGKLAPKGKATFAKKIIVDALEKACLINANKVYYLQAIKE